MIVGDRVYVYEYEDHKGEIWKATIRKVNIATVIADVIVGDTCKIIQCEVPKEFVGESK